MIKVEDMPVDEMKALLRAAGFGHLGCSRDNRPYVLPMHYTYEGEDIFIFTTEGMKTEIINANPEVCLQVEEIRGPAQWRSVMVRGQAQRITARDELEHSMQIITRRNPTLTPALNMTQVYGWDRPNKMAIYRIHPSIIDGRQTVE
jgi:nitroimidazol reductase NimA-like FMN-containing flavoprotein (pyridoxamine 5'-phosphate oxidase superfamily)